MSKRPAISFFGDGAVSGALQDFFAHSGYEVCSVWSREKGRVFNPQTDKTEPKARSFPERENELGEWVFITTPDNQIRSVANELSKLPFEWKKRSVIHCSGGLTSGQCEALAKKGAKIVSMHPVQTFKKGDGRERFTGIYISLEGDLSLVKILGSLAEEMGAAVVELSPRQKQVLHVAAVFTSNYMVTLLGTAEELLKKEGISEGLKVLKPLADQTLKNIFDQTVEEALSGPIARGDQKTVQTHLDILTPGSDTQALYCLLGNKTLMIASKSGRLTVEQVKELRLLMGYGSS